MRLAAKRVGVYVRTTLVVIVVIAIGTLLLKNRNNEVAVWFFGVTDESVPINVLWLILVTAAGTLLTWWVLRMARHLLRDIREIERVRERKQLEATQRAKEAELADREKRIDEKLRRAIGSDGGEQSGD